MQRDDSDLLGADIPDPVTIHELSELIGIGERQINALAMRGVFDKTACGRLDTRKAIRAYLAHCKKAGSADLETEKIRVQRETADKLELANAATRRELIPAADVEREWASVLRDVRVSMLAIPARVQQRIPHLTAHDIGAIDREIRNALTETAK
ncbi:terminase small subunit [Aurantimonas coralicida]|jgi:phage terminase Nu1 subunit (DNA packaging protein)|uniref:terminase small subunit n=1 Tax=Aurantimonas coralicida TaxID=182270 RepID=UPI0023974AD6|nr:terminase small subunit [Aurantimonas coralicida]MDE0921799.1 terminase small subunit [Aurantimonas coralicida]